MKYLAEISSLSIFMSHPRPLFVYFRLFQQTFLFYNRYMCKNPSSLRCWDLNPQPSGHESPPITTTPGLPPLESKFFFTGLNGIRKTREKQLLCNISTFYIQQQFPSNPNKSTNHIILACYVGIKTIPSSYPFMHAFQVDQSSLVHLDYYFGLQVPTNTHFVIFVRLDHILRQYSKTRLFF